MFNNSASVFEDNSFEVSAVFREKSGEVTPGFKNPRNKKMYDLKQSGLTFKEIGFRYGVTPERVRQITLKFEKDQRRFFSRQMKPLQDMLNLFQEISDRDAILVNLDLDFVHAIWYILGVRLWQIKTEQRLRTWRSLVVIQKYSKLFCSFESQELVDFWKSGTPIFCGSELSCRQEIRNWNWWYQSNPPQIIQSKSDLLTFAIAPAMKRAR